MSIQLVLTFLSVITCDGIYQGINEYQDYYHLPELPYKYDQLEPWIDAKTVDVHHSGHHAAYTAKMNAALQEWRNSGEEKELAHSSIGNILKNIDKVPQRWRTSIRNNGGGYVNHIFYFSVISPNPLNDNHTISANLRGLFRKSFVNMSQFETWMTQEAIALFGSGYVWLCREPTRNYLTVYSTIDQITPLQFGLQPILVIDVWEHAYYLKHQNKRKSYIESWWRLIDWAKVEHLYEWWRSFDPKHEEL